MAFKLTKIQGIGKFHKRNKTLFDNIGGKTVVNRGDKGDIFVEVDVDGDRRRGEVFKDQSKIGVMPDSNIVSTKESEVASFSTLYNNFSLITKPYYNFYEDDEETNDELEPGNIPLEEIPRFIRITWNIAPQLDREDKIVQTDKKIRKHSFVYGMNKDVTNRDGFSINKKNINNFDDAVDGVANGFISPGTLNAIVEVPLEKKIIKNENLTKIVDERKFLESEDTFGISIDELNFNLLKRSSGIVKLFDEDRNNLRTKTSADTKSELFDGKYSTYSSDGMIKIRNISSNFSSVNMDVAIVNEKIRNLLFNNRLNEFDEIVKDLVKNNKSSDDKDTKSVEISFSDPCITNLIDGDRAKLAKKPEHLENIAGLSPYMTNLFVFSQLKDQVKKHKRMPEFPASEEDFGTRYVGYILEKYKQNQFGVFELIDEIRIPNREIREYIDTKVVYGGVYRYRIRSLLSWTKKPQGFSVGGLPHDLLTYKTSYFVSEWNREWRYASVQDMVRPEPPDQFTVRPQSNRRQVSISWTLPDNRQKDIYYYILYRKLKDKSGKDVSSWEQVGIFFGANNVLFVDADVDYFQNNELTYVYAALTVTKHDEISHLSSQIAVRLNSDYVKTGEYQTYTVSDPGVNIVDMGQFSIIPTKRRFEKVNIKDRFLLTGRTGLFNNPFLDKTYCIRIKSLDTGQNKDVILDMTYNNLKPKIRISENVIITEDEPEYVEAGSGAQPGPKLTAGGVSATAKHTFAGNMTSTSNKL